MHAAPSGPVQAIGRCGKGCGKGCGDTCLNISAGKIHPEDFTGRPAGITARPRGLHILGVIDEFHGSGHEPLSGQRLAADAGNPRSPARPRGGLTGLERGLDGGRDELRCLRIDDDVPVQQDTADNLPCVREHAGRASGGGGGAGGIGLGSHPGL